MLEDRGQALLLAVDREDRHAGDLGLRGADDGRVVDAARGRVGLEAGRDPPALGDRVRGGQIDLRGVVEFAATLRAGGRKFVQRERSRFVVEDGRWVYVDGELGEWPVN